MRLNNTFEQNLSKTSNEEAMNCVIPIQKALLGEEKRIAVFIPKDNDFISKIKKIPNRHWSAQHKCWHFPYSAENWAIFQSLFKDETLNIQKNSEPIRISTMEMVEPPKLELKKDYVKPIDGMIGNHSVNAIPQSAALNPQETAKQLFVPVNLETMLSNNTMPTPSVEKPILIADKIVVRLAHFWKGRLRLDFYYRLDWVTQIKLIDKRRWHPEFQSWSVPHSPLVIDILKRTFGDILQMDLTPVLDSQVIAQPKVQMPKLDTPPQYNDEVLRLVEKMTLKRMAYTTIKTYKNCFSQFLYFYNDIHPKDITKDQIIQYMLQRIRVDKISESVQNTFINAIKCYYEQVLGKDREFYDLQRPKRPFQLPNVLNPTEVMKLLQAVENLKHKCILLAIYSGGLRLSEVINLRLADIRRADKSIFVKAGKGKKDRFTLLSDTLLKELEIYYQHYKPSYWLFEGQTGGQYSARSVQNILKDAVVKSGVNPYATVHTLRHSFATHLVLEGVDILSVQKLMGHESPETTQIYVHLTGEHLRRIQSPLDKLKF